MATPHSLHIAIAAKGDGDIWRCVEPLLRDYQHNISLYLHIATDRDLDPNKILTYHPRLLLSEDPELFSSADAEHKIALQLTRCPDNTSILKLWGIALANAKSEYVAVLDCHCPPATQWLLTVISHIEKSPPVFYGSVEPGWALSDRRIVGYLIEYAQFKSPIDCDSEFPGNNIVFKTTLLGKRDQLVEKGFFKTFMLWQLRERNNTSPIYCDNMPVNYRKTFQLKKYLQRRILHGRCFAACRTDLANQPPRWACILFTPFLFLLRSFRIFQWLKRKPQLLRAFYRFLPVIVISEIAWSYGEFMGYSFGERGACQHLD